LFRCESLILRTHWVMVVMDQMTRNAAASSSHRSHPTTSSAAVRSA
jgi:hypothetical protein